MTKHEIYEALKADGAKLPKAERFMSVDDLKAIYEERFGVSPDAPAKQTETKPEPEVPKPVEDRAIHLLRFTESGWCPALNRCYTRGLYRPATFAEYEALKPYAAEVL